MGTFNPGGPFNNNNPQTVEQLVSVQARNQLTRIYPLKTGQTTSFAAGDDGYFKQGRPISPSGNFFTLNVNNVFGNTNRFTDENGLQVYSSNYIIDHETGLGWYRNVQPLAAWAAAVAQYASFSITLVGGNVLSGFFVPNLNELASISNQAGSSTDYFNYSPFNIDGSVYPNLWTSTTPMFNNANAIYFFAVHGTHLVSQGTKTTLFNYIMCRIHFQ